MLGFECVVQLSGDSGGLGGLDGLDSLDSLGSLGGLAEQIFTVGVDAFSSVIGFG